MKVRVNMKPAAQIIRDKGLHENGDVQKFHTNNVLKRIKRYMPYGEGGLYKITVIQTDISKPEIVTAAPQAQYLFQGKKMVNAKTGKGPAMIPGVGPRYKKGTILKATNEPLNYNRSKNPQAGPHWDRALVAAEGSIIVTELQNYIKYRRG